MISNRVFKAPSSGKDFWEAFLPTMGLLHADGKTDRLVAKEPEEKRPDLTEVEDEAAVVISGSFIFVYNTCRSQ